MAARREGYRLPAGALSSRCELLLDVTVETIRSDPELRLCEGLRLIEAARTAIARMAPEALDDFERHVLPVAGLETGDAALAARLATLGTRAKETERFVVITAPVDAWSRWIYQQMNGAPPARRLRARAEIGPQASVELRALAD